MKQSHHNATGAALPVRLAAFALGFLLLPAACADEAGGDGEDARRFQLLAEIQRQVQETSLQLGSDELDPRVAAALLAVPRHEFVPPMLRAQAYRNRPLPIGAGQTISQPYIVAIMSQLLGVGEGDRVYELGTGSGYQAAVLAEMGVEVYTVEIVPELAELARATLGRLGYRKVHVRAGDGWLGWPEAAPFDGIIVTAAAEEIPRPLVDQLKTGGRLVIPVGPAGWVQQLILLTKQADGTLARREILPVRFVPVTGEHAP
jgi:protein-L-isoaspartate(D-aspartate) O-methyltransferase